MHADDRVSRLLDVIATTPTVSQRRLAMELRVALGLVNRLMRRSIADGLIEVCGTSQFRTSYRLTRAGAAERVRRSQARLAKALEQYREIRERWAAVVAAVSASWSGPGLRGVMLFGTGAIAEIGFLSLEESDLTLCGVFDDRGRDSFFGAPVLPASLLSAATLQAHGDARLIVATHDQADQVRARLRAGAVPREWTFWV